MSITTICIAIVLIPLLGALVAGLLGKSIGRSGAHNITIGGMVVTTILSAYVFWQIIVVGVPTINETIYVWGQIGDITLEIGFLIDQLSVTMLLTVSFVSLMVHIYTIGYMHEDPGYQRFFSYISLFTFAMLTLVLSNNFLQLFFGWEAVGVVSYLLIGFWFTRESAIRANLKAFLVNRVGDFGFLLGIAGVLYIFGDLRFAQVFADAPALQYETIEILPGVVWSAITLICILLFVGAMGKSAQFPLHVWLPDSMEGPTPISALIHAATMVTAGIFMVARMSPLFELSTTALSVVLIIGAITAFAMGLLGLFQHDIKRVVAYSTLSQLGYMTVALGASAYSAAIFHLFTHAFFKALLFLAAGSVIIAMHHEQDMRKMGGLKKYMPWTWLVTLIGTLALIGFPGFAGFFSKDSIIEAAKATTTPGATFAYWCVLLGVFITSLYSFRLYFLVFHGEERMDEETKSHLHESPFVVTGPLIALAIASIGVGAIAIGPMLFGGYFGESIHVLPQHNSLAEMASHFDGWFSFAIHGFLTPPFVLALGGFLVAWFLYHLNPHIPEIMANKFSLIHSIMVRKYGFDELYEQYAPCAGRMIGNLLWQKGDKQVIDGFLVNGTAKSVGVLSSIIRNIQTGYLYSYAFVMIAGLVCLISLMYAMSN